MLLNKDNNKYQFDLNILILSFLIIFFKWLISFLIFENENIINKILFDIPDIHYFPYIFNIIDLNFSPDYIDNFSSENNIPIPYYSIIFHAIFLKIFGFYSFFILEFIFLYFFLLILVKILDYIDLNYYLSLATTVFIFSLPMLVSNLQISNINLNIIDGLFSFRFPRPLVTSCYFFWGIYLIIRYYKDEKFTQINFVFLGICLSLIFVSYYFNFINLFLLILIIFFYKIFENIEYLKNNYKKILISILIFIISVSPFLTFYANAEKDFFTMIGVINLNYDLRIELLSHFIKKIFSLKFIIIFGLITFLMLFLLKIKATPNVKNVKFFYYLFISSVISPFFFTIVSPSISEIYNFLNWILIISLLVVLIYLSILINYWLNSINFYSLKLSKFIFVFISLSLIIIYQFMNFKYLEYNNDKNLRKEYLNVQKLIDSNSKSLNTLMSFSIRPQVLWIFKNKNNFTSIESTISSLDYEKLEANFFANLKFLGISEKQFSEIISNKKGSWRFDNEYIGYISLYKYQANSLVTFENTNDFEKKELDFILKSSPTKTQQIVVPRYELNRLSKSYANFELDNSFRVPELIILDKKSLIAKFSIINDQLYCKENNFNNLEVYTLNELQICNLDNQ